MSPFGPLQMFGQTGEELKRKLGFSNLKRGDAICGLYEIIDPCETSKHYYLQLWWKMFAMGKIGGWKYYYSKISNKDALALLKKLGG